MASAKFLDLLDIFENALASFYGFDPVERAAGFLISDDEIEKLSLGDPIQRAQVLVNESHNSEECFIGIYFSPQISQLIHSPNSCMTLTPEILDHWFVVMEELSHFHLILNRIQKQQATRLIELEYQAEIDKVLVIAKILQDQFGYLPHHQSLLRLNRQASFTSSSSHYIEASYLANKTLEGFNLSEEKSLDRESQSKVRQLYNLDFSGKLNFLTKAA